MIDKLALTAIDAEVTQAQGTGRMQWYRLPPKRWSYRSTGERDAFLNAGANRYAAFAGRRIRLRVTSSPYPVEQWGRAVDDEFPDSLPAWGRHLLEAQNHMLSLTLAERETFLGVELQTPRRNRRARREEQRRLDAIAAGAGLNGRPVTPNELERLMHRSVGLGHPAPPTLPPPQAEWEKTDLAAFTDRVSWRSLPDSSALIVSADVNGNTTERYVVVLSMGRMGALDMPDGIDPWLQKSDWLFPVEWSVIADIHENTKARNWTRTQMMRIAAQMKHWAAFGEEAPSDLDDQEQHALEVERELLSGNPMHTRLDCWVRAAVSGDTPKEAVANAQALQELYLPQLPLHIHKTGKGKVAREFIPGEPLATPHYRRKMSVRVLAAGGAAVTATVGDRSGFYLGPTAGASRRAVFWHPWLGIEERDRSGTTIIAASPGGGKSTLLGVIGYWSTLAGVSGVFLDPSGPLARLANVPEIAAVTRAVDLMNAGPGAMNPYMVTPNPRRDHYLVPREDGMTDEQWRDACELNYRRTWRIKEAERRTRCVDTLIGLLPQAVAEDMRTLFALTEAAEQSPAHVHSSPWTVVAKLAAAKGADADHARSVARLLQARAEMPQVQLVFPPRGSEDDHQTVRDDYLLTILTMRGNVVADPNKPRREWSVEETVGMPLLTLAAALTQRNVYTQDLHARKLTVMDEVDQITRVAAGVTLVRQLSRDTRKFNDRAIFSGQNPDDSLTAGIDNVIDNAFIGWMKGAKEQSAGLRVLGVSPGYESAIAGLSPRERMTTGKLATREFLFSDGDGGVEKIEIDRPPALIEAVDTTPNAAKAHLRKLEAAAS